MEKANAIIRDAIVALEKIPPDVGFPEHQGAAAAQEMNEQEEANVSASAPPVSTTKGSRRRWPENEEVPQPHFPRAKIKKSRKCSRCGLYNTGHNASTCERAQNQQANGNRKRPRGRPNGSGNGGGMKNVNVCGSEGPENGLQEKM